jgi:hypothetical protein
MSEKENPFKERLNLGKIDRTVAKYFEQLAGDIRKSIKKIGITGENPKDEAVRLIKTITSFDILSSIKTRPENLTRALDGVPRRVLVAAESLLMKKEHTGILDVVLQAIRLKLGRNSEK